MYYLEEACYDEFLRLYLVFETSDIHYFPLRAFVLAHSGRGRDFRWDYHKYSYKNGNPLDLQAMPFNYAIVTFTKWFSMYLINQEHAILRLYLMVEKDCLRYVIVPVMNNGIQLDAQQFRFGNSKIGFNALPLNYGIIHIWL